MRFMQGLHKPNGYYHGRIKSQSEYTYQIIKFLKHERRLLSESLLDETDEIEIKLTVIKIDYLTDLIYERKINFAEFRKIVIEDRTRQQNLELGMSILFA